MDDEMTNKIKELIRKEVPTILKGTAYTDRKLGDTPTDNLSLVPRKYVNLSGVLAGRPTSSVATMGQRFFATNLNSGTPITYNAFSSVWSNGVGSIVAQG